MDAAAGEHVACIHVMDAVAVSHVGNFKNKEDFSFS